MILSYEKGLINLTGFEQFKYKENTYYFSGLIWMRGKKSGKDTIEKIALIYEEKGIIPFIEIFGSFYCIIKKNNGEMILFTDNSNMHCYYIGEKALSDNYLDSISVNASYNFNNDALCEFIVLGNVYFGKTLVDGINISESEKYYVLKEGTLKTYDKCIGDIDAETSITDMNTFFDELAYSISDLNSTLSLTGGYDSRLVFACLRKHINLDVFISGNNEKDSDINYSKKVAEAGGTSIEVIKTKKPNITEDYIKKLFKDSQGIVPFLNNGYIRIDDFIKNRAEKGYNCYITGDGGVLHKDWWWAQDFPCYRKKSFNFNRFYSQRINYINEKIPLGNILYENEKKLHHRIVNELIKLKKVLNTQTYDSIYFNLNGKKVSSSYSVYSNEILTYAPLWERELVRFSYHLPRKERFFYNSMRAVTTNASKEISRIPTVYGTTSSCEIIYKIRDVAYQGIDYFKKFCRMLGRKVLNRNLFVGKLLTWSVEQDVRKLPIAQDSLDFGIKKGFIMEKTKLEDISFNLIGKLVQIYLLSQYMEKNDGQHPSRR